MENKPGKTIKQIADEIGVKKPTLQQRLRREPLCTSIQPYISTVEGTKYINVDGENLIKSAYSKLTADNVTDNIHDDKPPTTDNEVYIILRETIDTLRKQLEVKDEQILNQNEIIKDLSKSIKADRDNELAGTIIEGQQKLLTDKSDKKRWQFWKKN